MQVHLPVNNRSQSFVVEHIFLDFHSMDFKTGSLEKPRLFCSRYMVVGRYCLVNPPFDSQTFKKKKKNYLIDKYILICQYLCHVTASKQFFVSMRRKSAPLAISHKIYSVYFID